jgi:hypothetical protein
MMWGIWKFGVSPLIKTLGVDVRRKHPEGLWVQEYFVGFWSLVP